jgi:hypothetical protein
MSFTKNRRTYAILFVVYKLKLITKNYGNKIFQGKQIPLLWKGSGRPAPPPLERVRGRPADLGPVELQR